HAGLAHLRQVADQSVDDEGGDATVPGLGADEIAQHGVALGAAGVDHHDVARARHVQYLVHHQVVAGKHFHRAGRPADRLAVGDVVDAVVHRVHTVEDVGNVRRLELGELAHQFGGRAFDLEPDAEAGPGIHLGRLGRGGDWHADLLLASDTAERAGVLGGAGHGVEGGMDGRTAARARVVVIGELEGERARVVQVDPLPQQQALPALLRVIHEVAAVVQHGVVVQQ